METNTNQDQSAMEQRLKDVHDSFVETMHKCVEKHPDLLLAEVAHVMLNLVTSMNMEFVAMQMAMTKKKDND